MAVNLTSGAITKILTGECTENDLKPVLQVTNITRRTYTIDNKQWYGVALSDGSFWQLGYIPYDIFISKKLQKGSIVQWTKFQVTKHYRYVFVCDLNLLCTTCNIIGDPKLYPLNETPSFERSTPTIPDKDHTNSHHVEEPPTSKQKQDHVNLTPGAITKIMTGNIDLKPVLQLSFIKQDSRMMCSINGKQWYGVMLSDGSSKEVGFIADEMIRSQQLQIGSIVQLTKFQLRKDPNIMGEVRSGILVSDLTVIHCKHGKIGDPKLLPVERTAPTFPDEDQIHANSHHVEEPPTSIQNPSTSAQKCSSHSITQNNTDTMMGVNLTLGAITKIMTDKCSSTDLKPVVQVTNILSGLISTKNDKQCYRKIVLSDGSSSHFGCIADEIFISKKLQKGSIVQLTKFQFTKFSTYGNIRVLLINDLNVIHRKCDIIVTQEPFPRNDIPLVERSTPPILDEDHVDVSHAQGSATSTEKCSETQSRKEKHQSSNETPVLDRSKPTIMDHDHSESDTNEDVDNSHPAEEPSATTQKCSSHSLNQSKKRKRRSSNDNISKVVEDVSKMTKLMMEKIKTVEVGFKRLETLEEDVSKMAKMVEKNKNDDVGACFKKLETLEEDVSKLTRMMMEKNKEDDMGACIEKLDKMGWGAEEPIYDTALLLFLKGADYRKLWLHLKPECCGKWVKIAGSIFGLLD